MSDCFVLYLLLICMKKEKTGAGKFTNNRSIKEKDELIPIDYDGLMEKVEKANEIVQKNKESSIIADFRAKTNEMFHDISEMNPAEIEEIIKCHVQAKIDEYDIDAIIIDAVVIGSRCRGLERDRSDLDVVV